MYEFQHEARKKTKIHNVYIVLFIIASIVNSILILIDGQITRGLFSLLLFLVLLYFGRRKKSWAMLIIKFMVWLHIILLIVFAITIFI
ncbi:hypothetical protein WKH57_11545 [Niallia taxi]|uniref:hypothetical protein n=1 Tax=Niallia taxi TaxID=2499688 RepID=UPI00317838F2